jgi:Lar family restriction alleviation protein
MTDRTELKRRIASGAETVVVTLLPCPLPWCGSSAVRLRYWQGNKRMHYVECECCKIKTQQSRSKERVIAAWNTRTQADALAVMREAEGALAELIQQCWDCERELTESYYGVTFTGESLPLCNARTTLANLRAAIARREGE